MNRKRRSPVEESREATFEAALGAMGEDALRGFLRAHRVELEPLARGAFDDALATHAARAKPSFAVPTNDASLIADAQSLVTRCKRLGEAAPMEVDDILQRAGPFFLAGDFATARAVYEAVIPPLAEGEINLGQDEMVDEMLTHSTDDVGGRLLVSVYETTPLAERPDALIAAVEMLDGFAYADPPLACMDRAATRPLTDLEKFLPAWLERLRRPFGTGQLDWMRERMLREAVRRAEGTSGLAHHARTAKSWEAYYDWCEELAGEARWDELLAATAEAAEQLEDIHAASFHDAAAAVAEHLGRERDVETYVRAALLAAPSVLRLLRVLGCGDPDGEELIQRARALANEKKLASPRVGALLAILSGNTVKAAEALAKGTGLGWSDSDHPGRIVFAALVAVAGGAKKGSSIRDEIGRAGLTLSSSPFDFGDDVMMLALDAGPFHAAKLRHVAAPELSGLLERSKAAERLAESDRKKIVDKLAAAAMSRLEGVIGNKRRSHYGDVAVRAVCVAELKRDVGGPEAAATWMASINERARPYPALRSELARALARSTLDASVVVAPPTATSRRGGIEASRRGTR